MARSSGSATEETERKKVLPMTESPESRDNENLQTALPAADRAEAATIGHTESSNKLVQFSNFLREVGLELRRITWPDRKQIMRETASVLVLVTILTAMVYVFDIGLAKVVFEPLDHFARRMGGGIGSHH